MAKITRPGEKLGDVSRRPLSVGGVLNAGLSASRSGQALQQFGQALTDQALEIRAKEKAATQTAVYSNVLNESVVEYQQALNDRQSKIVDENGNPMYDTLVDDAGVIGEEIIKRRSRNIQDPEVRKKFEADFRKHVGNQQVLSIGKARSQRLEFARTSLSNGIESSINQAAVDDPDNVEEYINKANALVDTALHSGTISPSEAKRLKDNATSQIKNRVILGLIKTDPEQTLKDLENNEFNVDADSRDKLMGYAEQAIEDRKTLAARKQKEAIKAAEEKQELVANELDIGIEQGAISQADVLEQLEKGNISKKQEQKLRKKIITRQAKEIKDAAFNQSIDKKVVAGESLHDFTPSQLDKHYKSKLEQISRDPETGQDRPINFITKAQLASNYRAPIKSFTNELEYNLVYGDETQSAEALNAYQYLNDKNKISLSKMSKESQAIASIAATNIEASSSKYDPQGYASRIRQARKIVLEMDPEQKRILNKNFKDAFPENKQAKAVRDVLGISDENIISRQKIIDPELKVLTRKLLRESYLLTGSKEAAIHMTRTTLSEFAGPSEFNEEKGILNDKEYVMMFPPEKVFPGVPVDVLKENLNTSVAPHLPEGVAAEDVVIQSDGLTNNDSSGVSYSIFYKQKAGDATILVPLTHKETRTPIRWRPDADEISDSLRSRESKRRAEELESAKKKYERTLDTQRSVNPQFRELNNESSADILRGNPTQVNISKRTQAHMPLFERAAVDSKYVNAEELARIADIESRGNPNAVSPTGAKGLFQFIGSTWRDVGGKGSRFDIVENTKAAVRLANRNGDILRKRLGRDPTAAEIYMAHNIGAGGALQLLTADPNQTVTRSLLGSNPKHNPKFFLRNGRPVTVGEALIRYDREF